MKLLAFDTSGKFCSVALCIDDKIKVKDELKPMQQTALILPMIDHLLKSFSLTVNQLDAIAYGSGPGSLTGVRIATCVAQALSFANNIPIIRLSSLAALALAAFHAHQWEKLLVALDARGGQIYWAIYEHNQEDKLILCAKEELFAPETIPVPQGAAWYGVGDGWECYRLQLVTRLGFSPKAIDSEPLPLARALLELAKIKYDKGDWTTYKDAHPTYLR